MVRRLTLVLIVLALACLGRSGPALLAAPPSPVPPPRTTSGGGSSPDGGALLRGGSGTSARRSPASSGAAAARDSGTPEGVWLNQCAYCDPPAMDAAAMAADPANNTVVLFGGCCDSNFHDYGGTWTWNGSSWSQAPSGSTPTPRDSAAMAYDPNHRTVVLFGGNGAGCGICGDTWTWDGSSWFNAQSTGGPPARAQGTMAWDGTEIVLFGGCAQLDVQTGRCISQLGDTWTWNGSSWTAVCGTPMIPGMPTTPPCGPTARSQGSMASTPGGGAILFGGYNGSILGDTWIWNGNSWRAVCGGGLPACNPAAREGAAMALQSSNRLVVLSGGYDGANQFGDTWTWDGSNWTAQCGANGGSVCAPQARTSASMADDTATGAVFLFGGYFGGGLSGLADDAWNWGPPPPPVANLTLTRDSGSTVVINQKTSVDGYATDANGNAVAGEVITLSSGGGTVQSPVSTYSDGSFAADFTPSSPGPVSVTASSGSANVSLQLNAVNGINFGINRVIPDNISSDNPPDTLKVEGFGFDTTSPTTVTIDSVRVQTPITVHDSGSLEFATPPGLSNGSHNVSVIQESGGADTRINALRVSSGSGPTTKNLFGLLITYQGETTDASSNVTYNGPIYIGGNQNDTQDPIGSAANPAILTYTGEIIDNTPTGGNVVAQSSDGNDADATLYADVSSALQGPLGSICQLNNGLCQIPLYNGSFAIPGSGSIGSFLRDHTSFSIAGLSASLDGLDVNGNTITLKGSLSVGNATLRIDNLSIDPTNGVSGAITLADLSDPNNPQPIQIFGVGLMGSASFDQANNKFAANATISIPGLGNIGGGGAGFYNGGLQSVDLSLPLSPAAPIGPTGVYLTTISGGASGFQQPPLDFNLSAGFSWPTPDASTRFFDGSLGINWQVGNVFELTGNLNLDLLGHSYPLANATIDIYGDHTHIEGNLTAGPFKGGAHIDLYYGNSFSFSGGGAVTVTVPAWCLTPWGPCFGSSSHGAGVNFSNTGIGFYGFVPSRGPGRAVEAPRSGSGGDTVSATVPISGIPLKVSLDSQGNTVTTVEWKTPAGSSASAATTLPAANPVTITLPAGISQAALGLGWQTGDTDITLTDPNNVSYTPQSNASSYTHAAGSNGAYYIIQSPPAGTWTVHVSTSTPSSLGAVTPWVLGPVTSPSVSLSAGALTAGALPITYSAASSSGNGILNLYYNTSNTTKGGVLIASGLALGQSQTYQWTLPAALPSGTYSVYAAVDDGLNDAVAALAPQSVVWTNPNTPSAPSGLAVTAQNGVLHASWQLVTNAATYTVTLLDANGKTLASQPVGGGVKATLDPADPNWTGLATGNTYQVEVSAMLANGLTSVASSPVTVALPVPSFPVLSSLTWSASGVTGEGTVVVTGNESNTASFTVTVNGTTRYGPTAPNGSPFAILIGLYPGPNIIVLTATSPTGDTATASTSLAYSDTPPSLTTNGSSWNATTTNTNSLTVSGTTNTGNTVRINGSSATVGNNGAFSLATPLHLGSNAVVITATDALGQVSEYDGHVTFAAAPAVSASNSTQAADRTVVPADGHTTATITVTLVNFSGAAVSGKTVNITGNSGTGSTITPVNGTSTNSQGQVSFTATDLTPEAVDYTAQDTSDNVTLSKPLAVTFGKQGDVNQDGSVTATDALCVLRQVASLGVTTACPQNPVNVLFADVNHDTHVTSTDALCVLRIVAILPSTSACPTGGQAPNHAAAGAAAAGTASGTTASSSVAVRLNPAQPKLTKGKAVQITLEAQATGTALGAWTVDVRYDASTVKVTDCQAANGAVCNLSYAAGIVRISGASASGLTGNQTLATLTLTSNGKADAHLSVKAVDLADPTGAVLTGTLRPSSGGTGGGGSQPVPSPSPTPAPAGP